MALLPSVAHLGSTGDLPLAGGQIVPRIHLAPHLVDNRGKVVMLAFGRNTFALVDDEFFLRSLRALMLFRLWNGSDELCPLTAILNPLRRRGVVRTEEPSAKS